MTLKHFRGVQSLDEARTIHNHLSKKHHPDVTRDDGATMREVNQEYAAVRHYFEVQGQLAPQNVPAGKNAQKPRRKPPTVQVVIINQAQPERPSAVKEGLTKFLMDGLGLVVDGWNQRDPE